MTKLPYDPFENLKYFNNKDEIYKLNSYLISKIPEINFTNTKYITNAKESDLFKILDHNFGDKYNKSKITIKNPGNDISPDLARGILELFALVEIAKKRDSVRFRAAANPSLN